MKTNNAYQGFKPLLSAYIPNGGGYVIQPSFPFALGSCTPFTTKSANQFVVTDNGEWAGSFQYISTDAPTIEGVISCNISAQFAAIDDVISIFLYKNGVQCADSIVSKQFIAHNSFINLTYIDQFSINTNDYLTLYMNSINGNELQDMQMNVIINTFG